MNFLRILGCVLLALSISLTSTAQFTVDIPGGTGTVVTGINNSDHIVGYYTNDVGTVQGFYRTDGPLISFTIPGMHTWLGGINNNGQMVGHYSPTGGTNDRQVFIYDLNTDTYETLADFDGYTFTSANDINDDGQISGELKTGVNRRFFIWDPTTGLNTQNYLLDGTPAPTYGGHSIDASGRITGWYIDGANYISFRYHPDLGYTDIIDLPDPESAATHKTRLMGTNNNGEGVLDFILSDNAHIYKFTDPDAWTGLEKFIPLSTEIHLLDINDSGHMVGYYTDADFAIHGFADVAIATDFDLATHGHAFDNLNDPLWNWDFAAYDQYYATDPYWYGYNLPFPQSEPGFLFYPSSYPGWVDFVGAMSPQSCYFNINYDGVPFDWPVMRPHAFNSWKIHKTDGFEGACFGMSANTGASWQFPELLDAKFNPNGTGTPLYNVGLLGNDPGLISAANRGMAAQASQVYSGINAGWDTVLPHEIMTGLFASMTAETEIPVIGFDLQVSYGLFGHAVFPYAMVPREGELNTYDLYVYDPNAAGDTNVAFEIVYFDDISSYSIAFGEETTEPLAYGMQLMFAQDLYQPQLVPGFWEEEVRDTPLTQSAEATFRDGETDCVRVFALNNAGVSIDGEGGILTVNGAEISNTIPGARPRFRFTGQPETVQQFELPLGAYSVSTAAVDGGTFDAGLVLDGTVINYHRTGTAAGETDVLALDGSALGYSNSSGNTVNIEAEVMTWVDGQEWYFNVTSLGLEDGQTVTLDFTDEGLYISNGGSGTGYDVEVQVLDETSGVLETVVQDIPLGEGVTQIIIPDFGEDGLDGITVTESDTDPDTPDDVFDLGNTGLPVLITSTDTLLTGNEAQTLALGIGNIGSGVLQWEVTGLPAWATASTATTGENYGIVSLDLTENTTAERSATFLVSETGGTQQIEVYLEQSDGNSSVSEWDANAPLLYPNPAIHTLHVPLPATFQSHDVHWQVTALNGQMVTAGVGQYPALALPVDQLSSGVYVLKVSCGSHALTQQFIKIPARQ